MLLLSRRATGWGGAVAGLGLVAATLCAQAGFAQTGRQAEADEERQSISARELELIQRYAARVAENHRKIQEALEQIKEELAIVRIRVSR